VALRVFVCRTTEVVPGELRAFRVQGVTWPVLVTTVDGEIVAVPGVCPHEDVGLEHGDLDGTVLSCPGHGYGFDLRSGRCTHDPTLSLRRYKVTLAGDELWVDLL
jgi:nitrite reductase/ring-hydroxylating ferredoxin subunit